MSARRRLFDFASPAFTFVFTMGIVNLFADTTCEGGASINGPIPIFVVAGRATDARARGA